MERRVELKKNNPERQRVVNGDSNLLRTIPIRVVSDKIIISITSTYNCASSMRL